MTIDQAFDESVAYDDDWVKKALPNYDEIHSVAKELIPFASDARIDILDLGAGTGLFSQHVLERCPNATFVLYDVAAKMLEVAQKRFQNVADQFQFVVDDYRNLNSVDQFDLVISSLSIHHLLDGEKKGLFNSVHVALKNQGVFINIDQIKGPTPYFQELYWTNWLEKVRHREASEDRIQHSIRRRTAYDKDATLIDQMQWLRDAGFAHIDCVYKNYFVGVFIAVKQ